MQKNSALQFHLFIYTIGLFFMFLLTVVYGCGGLKTYLEAQMRQHFFALSSLLCYRIEIDARRSIMVQYEMTQDVASTRPAEVSPKDESLADRRLVLDLSLGKRI